MFHPPTLYITRACADGRADFARLRDLLDGKIIPDEYTRPRLWNNFRYSELPEVFHAKAHRREESYGLDLRC
jgi:hypothetical protein